MTDYVKSTNFASKDSLATGNPLKIVKGTEIDTEFNNIATAVATKADILSPTFTGTPAAPTATAGTNTTQLATTAFVSSAITAYDTALTVSTTQIEDNAVTNAKMADLSVGTAELIDDSVTAAKIAASAVGTSEIADAAVTTAKVANSSITPAKLTQASTGTAFTATTSGTSVTITGIPSWAKRVTVVLNSVSTSGISPIVLQAGPSGGVDTTDYQYQVSEGSGRLSGISGNGFYLLYTAVAANSVSGFVTLVSPGSNLWFESGNIGSPGGATQTAVSAGVKQTSGTLERIRLTTVSGTDTFDGGSIAIIYE